MPSADSSSQRPNFVFILADDLGYADLGCYGGRGHRTLGGSCSPVIDMMAAEGLRFTQGYANSPVCSPTRFALATGRYQYRLRGGADEPISSRTRIDPLLGPLLGLPPEHPTLASLLRDAGYRTALVGKWHLGYAPYFGPLKSGYEEFFGAMSGGLDYFNHCDPSGAHDLWEGEQEVFRIGYLTDLISERAVDYVRRQARSDKPFLLSVHYTAPHWPWETRTDEEESRIVRDRNEHIVHTAGGSVQNYLTMVRQMDEGIGRILEALKGTGADRNTMIVFTSDNGGERFSDVWPLVGRKMDLLEGGIRVPDVVRWPARIAAGGVTSQQAITMDWVATMLEAAGVEEHPDYPLDGASLLEVLDDPTATFDRELFWRMKYRGQKAMRAGQWKYLLLDGDEFLFDLSRDERERANRARREPQRVEAMRARYAEWEATVPAVPDQAAFTIPYRKSDQAMPSG
ncbi:MAG: sulfatase-like hydrolase/transferase [Burkholderiales bacterium]|nr:MAG: sulfatase-like hydrolase/transferase [Burkholderiales bacterium]